MGNEPFHALMREGSRLHAAGQLPPALMAFQHARRLRPTDPNAASACATLLSATGQHQAAWHALVSVRDALWSDAEGAANLAIAAEACGRMEEAGAAYLRALELDPRNLRALRNTALLAARAGQWDGAVATLRRCVELAPQDPRCREALADILLQARRFDEADQVLEQALQRFPGNPALQARQPLAWAFGGQLERAQRRFDAMDAALRDQVNALLHQGAGQPAASQPAPAPDARHLFCQQAIDAMQHCAWQDRARLASLLRAHAQDAARIFAPRQLRDILRHAQWLGLAEAELAQLRGQQVVAESAATPDASMPAFVATRFAPRDGRLRIGIAVPSLHEPRTAEALQQQLAWHDTRRFALHIYAATPDPDLARSAALAARCRGYADIAHMRPAEALARVRLDELDVFMDLAVDSPWWRPELAARRVAPIQLRAGIPPGRHHAGLYDYTLTDAFTHPYALPSDDLGALARLPGSCWLGSTADAPQARWYSRTDLGLPEAGLVLCCMSPAAAWETAGLRRWSGLLQALPEATLWLPALSPAARQQLQRGFVSAGIAPRRIVFMDAWNRAQWLGNLCMADLYVDGLAGHAPGELADALRMGLPAMTWVGDITETRMGGSILGANGMQDCIHWTLRDLEDAVVSWGKDPQARVLLRSRVQATRDTKCSHWPERTVHALETAWTMMVARHAAGLSPALLDVPDAPQ